jgi:hypothetical protein
VICPIQIPGLIPINALLLQPGLDLLPGETPLATHLESMEAAIVQHPVDGDAIYLEQVLQLSGCKKIVHAGRFLSNSGTRIPSEARHVKSHSSCCNKI